MRINIANIGRNDWLDYKSDISYGLWCSLRRLYPNVSMTVNSLEKDALNIIIGSDVLVGSCQVDKILSLGHDYSIFEVEKVTRGSINGRQVQNFSAYEALIDKAKFVLSPYRNYIDDLHAINSRLDVRYLRWGIYDEIVNPRILRSSQYNYDLAFFGLLKGERKTVFEQLSSAGNCRSILIDQRFPHTFREYVLSSTHAGLSLTLGDHETAVNPFRIHHMLSNNIPVFHNHKVDPDGYSEGCIKLDSDCKDVIRLADSFCYADVSDRLRELPLVESVRKVLVG